MKNLINVYQKMPMVQSIPTSHKSECFSEDLDHYYQDEPHSNANHRLIIKRFNYTDQKVIRINSFLYFY